MAGVDTRAVYPAGPVPPQALIELLGTHGDSIPYTTSPYPMHHEP